MRHLVFLLAIACWGGVALSAEPVAPVRGDVVLSDRMSATFFQAKRDGTVVLFRDYPIEGGKDVFEKKLFRLETDGEGWAWQDGYLPVLKVGKDAELVASGDDLFVRQGTAYTRWPDGAASSAAEFELARERVVSYWRKWFAAGLQLPPIDPKTDAAWKSSLVQALCLWSGRHPHYGAGFYLVLIHDGFPPTVLATVETLVQYRHVDEAVEILLFWLDRFLRADGTIDYYGPALSEYGALLWCSALVMDAAPDRAREIAAKLKPLVKNVLGWYQFQSPGGSLGENLILAGVPEADTRGRGKEYFHNNFQVRRGLRMIAPWYARLGAREFAAEIANEEAMLGRLLDRTYAKKRAELGGVPFAADQKGIPADIQSSLDSGYANYRYYPEMLETGYLSAGDAETYCRYRETHNGEWNGLCFLAVTNCSAEVDNWPIAAYARGLLEYGMTNRFERLLRAHLDNYLSDDTYTAYEQIANDGNPRRPVAPQCVPVQLVLPRLLAWKHAGYRPWTSYRPEVVVSGLRSPAGLADETGFALWRDGADWAFRFEVKDETLRARPTLGCERDMEDGDRVELYFSPDAGLKGWYYGIEIDPYGHVLDYRVTYPRHFDYAWSFPSLRAKATIREDGYAVEGRIADAALRELGINPSDCALGVFRADGRAGSDDFNWYSAVPFCAGEPDFHQPKMFMRIGK